jgi:hypothetical protein
MTDFADHDTISTVLDEESGPSAAGGGQAVLTATEAPSLRSDLESVFKEDGKAADKAEPDAKADKPAEHAKAEKPVKDEAVKPEAKTEKPEAKGDEAKADRTRADDGKFARGEHREEGREQGRDKEGRRFVEAPQSFLPQAREVWRNTPHAVQTEVARLVQEHTAASEQTREKVERYETIRQYDDLARSNGRELRESLEKMARIETSLQRNPVAALNEILMEVGPRKADGQPYSLYEIAQHVAQQDPQSYQQMVQQGREPEQPQEDPRIAQLEQRLAQVQEQTAQQQIVEPFKQAHPRFDELQGDIAFFLQSGKVPESLSPHDRLAAAYDMAERINPPSYVDDQAANDKGPAEHRRADEDFSGSKSIKSSPGSVTESYEPEAKRGESSRESLLAEMRRLNR